MALPANYSVVPVFGRYIDFTGAPMQGTVTFTPSQRYVTNPGADVLIFSAPLVATLDETGAFSIDIPATDDPDVTPQGFTWTVTEAFNRKGGRVPFAIAVPEGTPEPGIDLVTVAPVLPADQVSYIVTSVDGLTGTVDLAVKYAPLGEDGKVPLENLPAISSGVESVNGASGVVSLGAVDVGAMPLTGGTMQGPLNLHADPSDPTQASTKSYVDSSVSGLLSASGGAITGDLDLSGVLPHERRHRHIRRGHESLPSRSQSARYGRRARCLRTPAGVRRLGDLRQCHSRWCDHRPQPDAFTSGGTWVKPTGAKVVEIRLVGGGGGGGGGRRSSPGTVRCGGGGGAGGSMFHLSYDAAVLPTSVSVAIGAGGAGGTAAAGDSLNGGNGGSGGTTSFGTFARVGQAGGGTGGSSSSGTGGSTAAGTSAGGPGGSANTSGGVGSPGNPGVGPGAGGGAGGGVTNADVSNNGGLGGGNAGNQAGTAGLVGGTAAGSAQDAPSGSGLSGGGGGGGAASVSGPAGSGGHGAQYGGGGGGGGAALNGNSSGAGGNGADGIAVIITHF